MVDKPFESCNVYNESFNVGNEGVNVDDNERLNVDNGSDERFHVDNGINERLNVDNGSSEISSVNNGFDERVNVDNGSDERLNVENGSSKSLERWNTLDSGTSVSRVEDKMSKHLAYKMSPRALLFLPNKILAAQAISLFERLGLSYEHFPPDPAIPARLYNKSPDICISNPTSFPTSSAFSWHRTRLVVLDEADMLLESPHARNVFKATLNTRIRHLFVTASMKAVQPGSSKSNLGPRAWLSRIIERGMGLPLLHLSIDGLHSVPETAVQQFIRVASGDAQCKFDAVKRIVADLAGGSARTMLLFCNSRARVPELAERLEREFGEHVRVQCAVERADIQACLTQYTANGVPFVTNDADMTGNSGGNGTGNSGANYTENTGANMPENTVANGTVNTAVNGTFKTGANVQRDTGNPAKTSILICTDLLARGIDFSVANGTDLVVVNYDFPPNGQVYLHRSGRTARAGRSGRGLVSLLH